MQLLYSGFMKKKVGTFLEEHILYKAKAIAAKEGKKLNQIFEEALKEYTEARERTDVVKETKAVFPLKKETVKALLEEDLYDL